MIPENTPRLETADLILRRFTENDLHAVLRMLPQFRGRGIITSACLAVIQRAKRSGMEFITATHDRNNPKSGAVMQRLGMKYCYSYREQWQPKNRSVIFRMYQLDLQRACPVYAEYKKNSPEWFIEKI